MSERDYDLKMAAKIAQLVGLKPKQVLAQRKKVLKFLTTEKPAALPRAEQEEGRAA